MKTALFPGSFDPFSIGHQNIVQRGLCIFDKIVIGIGRNTKKQSLYTEEERKAQIGYLSRQPTYFSGNLRHANCRFCSRNRSKFHFERSAHQTGF